ncbi:hypothetical protein DPEC_G00019580 [Dallia pectoralis]|uniref:Uncharacterized protein n=1 Tax=Dallia pectoralis TaxID=75939 RepID=A0ACC2HFQ9_DALPE|nr:hypothetical protein DPEC_G00019580 [Dallia pectoralis]
MYRLGRRIELCKRRILECMLGTLRFRQFKEEAHLSGRTLGQANEDAYVSHQGSRTEELLCRFPFRLSRAVFPLAK